MNHVTQSGIGLVRSFTLVTFASLLVVACSDDDKPSGPDTPAVPRGTVSGVVETTSGGLENAEVRVGTKSTRTNEEGYFVLGDIGAGDVVVSVESDGYAPTYRSISVLDAQTTHLEHVVLLPIETEVFDAATGAEVATGNGVGTVVFGAGTLVTASGAAFDGDAEVSMLASLPEEAGFLDGFSGRFEGRRTDGSVVPFQSFGYMSVAITDAATGAALALDDGASAELRLDVVDGPLAGMPESVPMWYFDETEGVWIEEGAATLDGGGYTADVEHFTIWNWDLPIEEICSITGTVVSAQGAPVMDARVFSRGISVAFLDEAYTDAAGRFDVRAMLNSSAEVYAIKGSYASDPAQAILGTECPVELAKTLTLLEPAFTITLSWGEVPDDLDAHLFIPVDWSIDGLNYDYYHVCYYNEGDLADDPFTLIDTDDTGSFGPEIISSFRAYPGKYEYWVQRYSDEGSMKSSPTIVRAEIGGQTRTFDAATARGTETEYWHVFDFTVTSSGAGLTSINRFETPGTNDGWESWHDGADSFYPDTAPDRRERRKK